MKMKWSVKDGFQILTVDGIEETSYDIKAIFPDFEEFTEVQREVISYGIKQNLSDKIAGMKGDTLKEKVEVMDKRFESLMKGIWKSPSKDRESVKKKASKLVNDGVTPEEMALLKKLGLA